MSSAVLFKLLAIFVAVAIGWIVGKLQWLGKAGEGHDPARTLANAAYYIFVPALLFRTTARIDFQTMPWGTLVAVFVPLIAMLLGVYAWQRRSTREQGLGPAAPSVRAITAAFGNTVADRHPDGRGPVRRSRPRDPPRHRQPACADPAHRDPRRSSSSTSRTPSTATAHAGEHLAATLVTTARRTLVHPVVLPVLAGMAWNVVGLPLPAVADELLLTLGQAVVPLCLVLIGMSLAYHGVQGAARTAAMLSVLKLLVLPALVLAAAHWSFGLTGLPLSVVVMLAALPIGSNALIFAQRYRTLEAEATTATVFSTLAFVVSAPFWLSVLAWLR